MTIVARLAGRGQDRPASREIDARSATVNDVIHRLQEETASVRGITLYMQPSQDLSLDTTVSRTQYQFILESANADTLGTWTP